MPEPPMTEQELEDIAKDYQIGDDIQRLIAEVRRLREENKYLHYRVAGLLLDNPGDPND